MYVCDTHALVYHTVRKSRLGKSANRIFVRAESPVEVAGPDPRLAIRYYHTDHLGTSVCLSDGAGELVEETGVETADLEQLYTAGDPGRDPRGWTVSVAYLARVHPTEVGPVSPSGPVAPARGRPRRRSVVK